MAVISAIRREKASRRLPLNAVISRARVYAANEENAEKLRLFHQDICGTCKVDKLDILPTSGEGAEVEGYPEIRVEIEA